MGCIKDVSKILDARVILRLNYDMLLHAITPHVTTMLLRFVTCYYTTLDSYFDVFVALTNPSLNTRMTDFFMLSYIASLPSLNFKKHRPEVKGV